MARATRLVRDCVLAGYEKLHLDASMSCADDPGGAGALLAEETATARTVELCRAAEEAARSRDGSAGAVYVIGTEVPAPGGERAGDAGPRVTRGDAVARMLQATGGAFAAAGLDAAWERVVAVVAQPGVEFGDHAVCAYDPARCGRPRRRAARRLAAGLRGALDRLPVAGRARRPRPRRVRHPQGRALARPSRFARRSSRSRRSSARCSAGDQARASPACARRSRTPCSPTPGTGPPTTTVTPRT